MNITINIDNYLSEDDKIKICKEAFKEAVYKNALENFKADSRLDSKRMSDYERIISNSVFYYLEGEIDKLIGQDTKELIKKGVLKTINAHDYKYSLFRVKSTWDTEDSPANLVVKETINEIKPQMKEKITQAIFKNIEEADIQQLKDLLFESVCEVVSKKLTT